MVFKTAEWVGDLPFEPPSNTLVADFLFTQLWPGTGPTQDGAVSGMLVCAVTGASWSMPKIRDRVDLLARSLCKRLDWQPNIGSPWNKVVGIFSVNTVGIRAVGRMPIICQRRGWKSDTFA